MSTIRENSGTESNAATTDVSQSTVNSSCSTTNSAVGPSQDLSPKKILSDDILQNPDKGVKFIENIPERSSLSMEELQMLIRRGREFHPWKDLLAKIGELFERYAVETDVGKLRQILFFVVEVYGNFNLYRANDLMTWEIGVAVSHLIKHTWTLQLDDLIKSVNFAVLRRYDTDAILPIILEDTKTEEAMTILISTFLYKEENSMEQLIELNYFLYVIETFHYRDFLTKLKIIDPEVLEQCADKILSALESISCRRGDGIYNYLVRGAYKFNLKYIGSLFKGILCMNINSAKDKINSVFVKYQEVFKSGNDDEKIMVCKWLERAGFLISCLLENLTPEMAETFLSIFNWWNVEFVRYYTEGAIFDLINVNLCRMRDGEKLPNVDKLGFLRLLVKSVEFWINDEELSKKGFAPISKSNLKTSFGFIEDALNNEGFEFKPLCVEYLTLMADAGFILEDLGDGEKIIIRDPGSEFHYEMAEPKLFELIEHRHLNRHQKAKLESM